MRYWALKLFRAVLKVTAVTLAITGSYAVIWSLMFGDLEDTLTGLNVRFADGSFSLIMIHVCGLIAWLLACLGVYALAHFLELMMSIERQLIAARWQLQRLIASPAEDDPAAPAPPDGRLMASPPSPLIAVPRAPAMNEKKRVSRFKLGD